MHALRQTDRHTDSCSLHLLIDATELYVLGNLLELKKHTTNALINHIEAH